MLDGEAVIQPVHLEAAVALWDYAEASILQIFGQHTGDPIADRILEALHAEGELSDADLSGLFRRNAPAARLARAKRLLQEANLIHGETVPTEGRPKVMWRPGPKSTQETK